MKLTELQLVAYHRAALQFAMKRLGQFYQENPNDPLSQQQRIEFERILRIVDRTRRQIGDQHITEADLAIAIRGASADLDDPLEQFFPQVEIAQDLYDAKMALADALFYFGRVFENHGLLETMPPVLKEGRLHPVLPRPLEEPDHDPA
jgi:hypothetical protein